MMKILLIAALTFSAFGASADLALAQGANERGAIEDLLPSRRITRDTPATQEEENKVCGQIRIIGGECASASSWPWQIALYQKVDDQYYQTCGGTLIASRWVLTAAHCVALDGTVTSPDSLLIVEGTHYLKQPGHTVKVTKVIPHENWNHNTLENDIALLNLETEARSTPVHYATSADADLERPETVVFLVGWGHTHPFQYVKNAQGKYEIIDGVTGQQITAEQVKKYETNHLMQVSTPLISSQKCSQLYADVGGTGPIDGRQVCAGFPEGGKGSCQGDSGGPMVVQNAQKQWVQIGVTSFGDVSCGITGHPSVYTRVSKFSPWIEAKINGSSSSDAVASNGADSGNVQDVIENATGAPNPAHLKVSFLQGSRLRVGDAIQIGVSTQKPGYLVLLDVTPAGKVTQIYPSELASHGEQGAQIRPLRAGEEMVFPDGKYTFKVSPPYGHGKLIAILTRHKIKELTIPQGPKTYASHQQALSVMQSVVAGFKQDVEDNKFYDPTASVATYEYTIE